MAPELGGLVSLSLATRLMVRGSMYCASRPAAPSGSEVRVGSGATSQSFSRMSWRSASEGCQSNASCCSLPAPPGGYLVHSAPVPGVQMLG